MALLPERRYNFCFVISLQIGKILPQKLPNLRGNVSVTHARLLIVKTDSLQMQMYFWLSLLSARASTGNTST